MQQRRPEPAPAHNDRHTEEERGNPITSFLFLDGLSKRVRSPFGESKCWCIKRFSICHSPSIAMESAITSSSTTFFPACLEPLSSERRKVESGDDLSVEDAIERSKVHWSQLTEHSESDKEEAEVSNVEVFRSLQTHLTWGGLFCTFGDGGICDVGELEVGEKFA